MSSGLSFSVAGGVGNWSTATDWTAVDGYSEASPEAPPNLGWVTEYIGSNTTDINVTGTGNYFGMLDVSGASPLSNTFNVTGTLLGSGIGQFNDFTMLIQSGGEVSMTNGMTVSSAFVDVMGTLIVGSDPLYVGAGAYMSIASGAYVSLANNLDVVGGTLSVASNASLTVSEALDISNAKLYLGGNEDILGGGAITGANSTIVIEQGATVKADGLNLASTDTLLVFGTLDLTGAGWSGAEPGVNVIESGGLVIDPATDGAASWIIAGGTYVSTDANITDSFTFSGSGGTVALDNSGTNISADSIVGFSSDDAIIVNGNAAPGSALTSTLVNNILTITAGSTTLATVDNVTAAAGSSVYMAGTYTSGRVIVQSAQTDYTAGSNTLGSSGTTEVVTNTNPITLSGSTTTLAVYDSLSGNGSFTIQNGATLALGNATGNDAGQTVVFGGDSGTSPNMLYLDGNSAGFGGTIAGFGVNDAILIGTNVLPALPANEQLSLNYSNGVLTVAETSAGNVVKSTGLTFSGTGLSTGSFVALDTTGGIAITTPAELNGEDFVFSVASATTGAIESPSNFTGGASPGDTLYSGETLSVTSGTAAVYTSTGMNDGGVIIDNSTFIDTAPLTGTGTLEINSGAHATLSGGVSLGTIVDSGVLAVAGSLGSPVSLASGAQLIMGLGADLTGSITGAGAITLTTGAVGVLGSNDTVGSVLDLGTLTAQGALSSTVNMGGNNAGSTLALTGADVANGTLTTALTSFGSGDTLVLGAGDFPPYSTGDVLKESYANNQLTVTDQTKGLTEVMNLTLAAGDNPVNLLFTVNGNEALVALCFYPGTMIATPWGDVAVENLRAGNLVLTANGAKPVRWLGQSQVSTRFADPLRALPIRIAAGALGEGLPVRDLLVSPDHALYLDGVLVHASALVGLPGITREHDVPETFTYHHVELATHELLFAEGALAESFVDNAERMHFQNWDDRTAPATPIAEMDLPRVKSARQLPAALRHRTAA
jgi:hypothetical protein